jgi:hypothetical protein
LNGVLGQTLAKSGVTAGVSGSSASVDGRGVYGRATANSGANFGVLGETDSATNGFGVFSIGRTGASGTKSFRIDHPSDPANKFLLHYSAEGPEPLNVYSGHVITDAQGYAVVTLPAYFEEINKDFRYQLTVVDDGDSRGFVQVKVAQKIRDHQFAIRSSAPNVEVSWEVKGVRSDLWARAYGAAAEVEKRPQERGKYQHPELYGQPKERGLYYDATRGSESE